jgi:methionyl aminopeptidase
MRTNNHSNPVGDICVLHGDKWLQRQRIAGKVASQTLALLERLVKEKTVKTLLELDHIAGEFITSNGCFPTFLGYKGFPANVCMSVDNEKSHCLVHGIPTDYRLQDGDLISFDTGASYEDHNGAIADNAITVIYGEPKEERHLKLIQDTEEALMKGIRAIKIGEHLGVIGSQRLWCNYSLWGSRTHVGKSPLFSLCR